MPRVTHTSERQGFSMHAKVNITFGEDSNVTIPLVTDTAKIDCDDYSEEKLKELLNDAGRRIVRAWQYMTSRESGGNIDVEMKLEQE